MFLGWPMIRGQVLPRKGVRITCNTGNYAPTVIRVYGFLFIELIGNSEIITAAK